MRYLITVLFSVDKYTSSNLAYSVNDKIEFIIMNRIFVIKYLKRMATKPTNKYFPFNISLYYGPPYYLQGTCTNEILVCTLTNCYWNEFECIWEIVTLTKSVRQWCWWHSCCLQLLLMPTIIVLLFLSRCNCYLLVPTIRYGYHNFFPVAFQSLCCCVLHSWLPLKSIGCFSIPMLFFNFRHFNCNIALHL